MKENSSVCGEIRKAFNNAGRTAENKGINLSGPGRNFPESEKKDKKKAAKENDGMPVALNCF